MKNLLVTVLFLHFSVSIFCQTFDFTIESDTLILEKEKKWLDMSFLKNGIYLLEINSEKGKIVKK